MRSNRSVITASLIFLSVFIISQCIDKDKDKQQLSKMIQVSNLSALQHALPVIKVFMTHTLIPHTTLPHVLHLKNI